MTDTAQPEAAAETDTIASAANAFKAFTSEQPVPRDDHGRFAAPVEEMAEPISDDGEAEEDAQEEAPEAHPLPPSWGNDDAELWELLPPETQAKIAEREGERDRAVNQKFQEAANVRKSAMDEQAAANAHRQQYADALEMMMQVITPVEPDPRAYGAGTGQYNREAYDFAVANYREQAQALQQLQSQRQTIAAQQTEEEAKQWQAVKSQYEEVYAPKLLADVPELKEPAKAEPLLRSLVDFAIKAGIPAETFNEDQQDFITSAQLHILWKAQQYDELRAKGAMPKAKPAGPAVRPGVSSPRSAQKAAQTNRINERLAREGSIEAGAAMWKTVFR